MDPDPTKICLVLNLRKKDSCNFSLVISNPPNENVHNFLHFLVFIPARPHRSSNILTGLLLSLWFTAVLSASIQILIRRPWTRTRDGIFRGYF
jgi:hypothetical protein